MLSWIPMHLFGVNMLWKQGIYPRETKPLSISYFCIPMITLVLVIIAKIWNKSNYESTHDEGRKYSMYKKEYY